MLRRFCVLVVGLAAAALSCQRDRGASGVGGNEESDGGLDTDGVAIETFATPAELPAGQALAIRCIASRDRTYLPGFPTRVLLYPSAGEVSTTTEGFAVIPTAAGSYDVRCESADGSVIDPRGVGIEVVPGPAAEAETVLAGDTAQAGAPTAVTCTIFDAYGNRVPDIEQHVIADGLSIDPTAGETFIVRGTLAGTYEVACASGDIVDATPESLAIDPGMPGASDTNVSAALVGPTESVDVSCSVTDDFGNPLDGIATSFDVLAGDGSSAAEAGLVLGAGDFSATRAGIYYVFCKVPGYMAGDESPAAVVVRPGLPHHWMVELATQDCYWQGRGLPVLHVVYDAWENVIDPSLYSLSVEPAGVVTVDTRGIISVAGEGVFDIAVDIASPVDGNWVDLPQPRPFLANVRVDSTPPEIVISSPARASMLRQGGLGSEPVTVSGTIEDSVSFIESAVIAGTSLAVSGTGLVESFSVPQSSRWGVSIIAGEATDGCGNRRVLAQSYLRGGGFFPAQTAPSPGSRAYRGILAHMNQPVIDDRNRSDLDDIASIGEVILRGLDFNTLAPAGLVLASDPLRTGCGFCDFWNDTSYTVRRHSDANRRINWAGPFVLGIDAVTGGLTFSIRLDQFDFPLEAEGRNRTCACGAQGSGGTGWISGWAGADRVDATGTLNIALAGGAPSVTVGSMNVAATNMYLNIDCGILSFVCDAITGLVMPYLESTIESAMADAIAAEIPPLVRDFLADFTLDTGFSLPPPLSTTVNMTSGLDYISFAGPAGTGFGELGLYTQLYPSARGPSISDQFCDPAAPSFACGAIRTDTLNNSNVAFDRAAYSFGLGLKTDLVNQILWAVWYGGGMSLDMTDLAGSLGVAGVSLTFDSRLPPVVMEGTNGNMVDIGLGDAYIDATVDLGVVLGGSSGGVMHVGMYLSTIIGGMIDLDPAANQLLVALDTQPTVYVEVVQIDDEGYQGVMSDLFTGLLRLLMPELLGGILGSFPLPDFDLAGLGVPMSDTVLQLTNGDLTRPDVHYLRLTGSLQ